MAASFAGTEPDTVIGTIGGWTQKSRSVVPYTLRPAPATPSSATNPCSSLSTWTAYSPASTLIEYVPSLAETPLATVSDESMSINDTIAPARGSPTS